MKKLTTEEFINKAKIIHGNTYNYSKSIYINNKIKIKIICNQHGEFEQLPINHLQGKKCFHCSGSNKKTNNNFIMEASKIHHNKYDYQKTNYINYNSKVIITCSSHGDFKQKPSHHLKGIGCSGCSKNKLKSNKIFIDEANLIHNYKYDYSKSNYENSHNKIVITCKVHGEFNQAPHSHLNGAGCNKCSNNISKLETEWLDILRISNRQEKIKINDFKIKQKVDGYDPINKVCYEFYGDYFHAHPNYISCLNRQAIHPHQALKKDKSKQKTNEQIYQDTLYREKQIKKSGYKLITIWEHEFNELNRIFKNRHENLKIALLYHAGKQLL